MMAARKHFDVAVAAFRAGAADVIVKAPDQVDYLRKRVVDAAAARRHESDNSRVLGDTFALHDDMLKVLLDTFRKSVDLEEKLTGGGGLPIDEDTSVLLVDDDPGLGSQLVAALHQRGGYRLRSVSTGGEALDIAGREKYQIALIKDALPDLPGSMVVRSIKAQSPEALVLLYTAPGNGQAGSMQVMEGSRAIQFLPQFTEVGPDPGAPRRAARSGAGHHPRAPLPRRLPPATLRSIEALRRIAREIAASNRQIELFQYPDVRQVAIPLRVVQSISNDE